MNIDGWVCLDKPAGISSNFAMVKVRKILQQRTGYVGTLDPFATGVLPIAAGRARHFIKYTDNAAKRYIFTVQFGAVTDTLDLDGQIIEENGLVPRREEIEKILPEFAGKILQIPPKFSAIKIKGRRACDLMRSGKNIDLAAREITIFDLSIVKDNLENGGSMTFCVFCSKGTYVRSLARDISERAGVLGFVKYLRRTECGFFSQNAAITMEKLIEMSDTAQLTSALISIDAPLGGIPAVSLESDKVTSLLQGRMVEVDSPPSGSTVRLYDEAHRFFGVCEVCDGGLIKPLSMYINC